MTGATGNLLTAGAAAATATTVWRIRDLPGLRPRAWQRTNHRGGTLTLFEGPAWAAGALAGIVLAPGLNARTRAAAVLTGGGAAVFGAVDDLAETGDSKGLRGHLGALRQGRVTTGALKILGIGATSLAAAAVLTGPRGPLPARVVDVGVGSLLLAAGANLGNLLDLRPGRVLKTALLAVPVAFTDTPTGRVQAAVTGAGLAMLPADLGEQGMLGDCGANAAGALLALQVLTATQGRRTGPVVRGLVLAGLVGLTLASEKVSFTEVIEATPGLREWDALGRRPPDASA